MTRGRKKIPNPGTTPDRRREFEKPAMQWAKVKPKAKGVQNQGSGSRTERSSMKKG